MDSRASNCSSRNFGGFKTKHKTGEGMLTLKMAHISFVTDIASGDQEIVDSLIGNSIVDNGIKINAKHIVVV